MHSVCASASFVRPPKGAEDALRDALKLHVVGVIFHGNPDRVHLFAAAPHLSGNSNLNCECLLRAMKAEYAEQGMLPRLHIQFDNAGDNKSRWVLGFCAWLIKRGWVKEVHLSMMMVGHTHEDIDAIFKLIQDLWRRLGFVLTPQDFFRMIGDAVAGRSSMCCP